MNTLHCNKYLHCNVSYKKVYKVKSAKGKGIYGNVQRKPAQTFKSPCPKGSKGKLYFSSNEFWQQIKCCLPGRYSKNSRPKDFIGIRYISSVRHIPESAIPTTKANVQHKPYRL